MFAEKDSAKSSPPLHPGQYIEKNILEKENISQAELARILGVSRQAVNFLINGQRPLTPTMAVKLSSTYGPDVEFWINLNNEYESWNKKQNDPQKSTIDLREEMLASWGRNGRILVDHEIRRSIELEYLQCYPFDDECLQGASYDLRVGTRAIVNPGTNKERIIDLEHPLPLNPGELVKVWSLETIKMPRRLSARIGPMSWLVEEGVFCSYGPQIDPGYTGEIFVTLENRRKEPIHIEREQPFLTIEFSFLGGNPERFHKKAASEENISTISGEPFKRNDHDPSAHSAKIGNNQNSNPDSASPGQTDTWIKLASLLNDEDFELILEIVNRHPTTESHVLLDKLSRMEEMTIRKFIDALRNTKD